MRTCKECKRELEDDVKYCPYCGTPLDDQDIDNQEAEESPTAKNPWMRILVYMCVSIGLMLCVAGLFTNWIIGMIGGGCVGMGYAIHKAYIKGGKQ